MLDYLEYGDKSPTTLTRFELTTSALSAQHSTTELHSIIWKADANVDLKSTDFILSTFSNRFSVAYPKKSIIK